MTNKKEKSLCVFKQDVEQYGGYLYADRKRFSAYLATQRQTNEIVNLIKTNFPERLNILDIGCGDGTYTFELFKRLSPKYILGIDPAQEAINIASRLCNQKNKIQFKLGNIYNINLGLKQAKFDLVIVRGVLHHLSQPEKAIKTLGKCFNNIIVLEPNGYNPILKLIEKISPYHRLHRERSYWPPILNSWFLKNGYQMKTQKFFGIVPYFCPKNVAKTLKKAEPLIEKGLKLNSILGGSNLILYQKQVSVQ